jgi:hypothetical protein
MNQRRGTLDANESAVFVASGDTPILVNRPLHSDWERVGSLSQFRDQRWNLTPAILEGNSSSLSIDFATVPQPFVDSVKLVIWNLLNHEGNQSAANRRVQRLAVRSIGGQCFRGLRSFVTWAHSRRIAFLCDVTDDDLELYLKHVSGSGQSVDKQEDLLGEVRRLWSLRQILPLADRLPASPPWGNDRLWVLIGKKRTQTANRTPRISPDTMEALLSWAMRFVDDFGLDITAAYYERLRYVAQAKAPGSEPAAEKGLSAVDVTAQLLARLAMSGESLPGTKSPDGVTLNQSHMGRLCGFSGASFGSGKVIEVIKTSGVPIREGSPMYLPIRGRLNGEPWRQESIGYEEAAVLIRHLVTACFVVIAYLSGMRPGEVLNLQRGCLELDSKTGICLVNGRHWKGVKDEEGNKQAEGTVRSDPWVVVEPVARAIAILESLSHTNFLFPPLLSGEKSATRALALRPGRCRGSGALAKDITAFMDYCNEFTELRGLSQGIPPDRNSLSISPSRFRRTLAWFICRRPRGLAACGIQYGHLHSRVTQGYAGTYEAGFVDDVAFEDWLERLDRLSAADEELGSGGAISGPAANEYRRRIADVSVRFEGRVLKTAREARLLLKDPALQVFEGRAMTCVFDPDKALCRKKARSLDSGAGPDLGRCKADCLNIARTDGDVAEIKSHIILLDRTIDDPLCPPIRLERERQERSRLSKLLDEHARSAAKGSHSNE